MNEDFIKKNPDCLERACFQIGTEDGNGHCGVLALQRTKRRYLGAPKNDVVPQGRQELVDAYRKHRAKFLKDHGIWFNVTDEDIGRRISIHLAAKKEIRCSERAWVNHMDLIIIWSMETEQTVYVVRRGEAHVDVFSGIDQRRADVSRTSSKVSCNEMCVSVGLSVCRSVCRRVFYLGVQMFCSETLSSSAFSTYPAVYMYYCTVRTAVQ